MIDFNSNFIMCCWKFNDVNTLFLQHDFFHFCSENCKIRAKCRRPLKPKTSNLHLNKYTEEIFQISGDIMKRNKFSDILTMKNDAISKNVVITVSLLFTTFQENLVKMTLFMTLIKFVLLIYHIFRQNSAIYCYLVKEDIILSSGKKVKFKKKTEVKYFTKQEW